MSTELIFQSDAPCDDPYEALDTPAKRKRVFNNFITFINNNGFPTDFTHTLYGDIHWEVIKYYFKNYPQDFSLHKFQVAMAKLRDRFRKDATMIMRDPRAKSVLPIWMKFAEKLMSSSFSVKKNDTAKLTSTIDNWVSMIATASKQDIPKETLEAQKHEKISQVDAYLDVIDGVF